MREIKFNCIITGNDKEKIAEFFEWLDGDGWKHSYYAPIVTNGVFHHEELGDGWIGEIIRRQYTGLKDKNGIEIYEGDVLDGHSDGYTVVEYTEANGGYDCVFSDDNSVCIAELTSWFGNQAIVIGNIYENAELLITK